MDGITEVVYLYLDDIIPNRFQPREIFDEQALKELAVSIKEHGVIQPIIVRKVDNKYEIIAGERRYKAATMAGLTKIPALVKNLDDKESSKIALIENLQRKDLTPIEEARTYQKILELEGNMTQQELAATMGKTQSSVSNKLRLLALPEEVQEALLKEKISERHARSLLNVEDKNVQIKLLDKIVADRMTVRELDKEIKEMNNEAVLNPSINEPTISYNNEPSVSFNETSVSFNTPISEPVVENPTTVNIDQIRENAVDINPTPVVTADTPSTPEENTEPVNKFMPSGDFGFDLNQSNKIEIPSPNEILTNFFNRDSQPETTIATPTETVTAPVKKDVNVAVEGIKNKIKELELSGYTFNMVETDNPTQYQIIINVNKD